LKAQADWLLAEMRESIDELSGYKNTAEWLMAERDVAYWLAAEAAESKRIADAEAETKVIESKIAEAPEEWRSFLEGKTVEDIDRFLEHVKSLPPVQKTEGTPEGEKPKRNFL
jgi:hypothetical protein